MYKNSYSYLVIGFIISAICLVPVSNAGQEPEKKDITVSISAQQYGKMPLLLVLLGKKSADAQLLVELTRHNLGWSNQFDITTKELEQIPTKQGLQVIADHGFPLTVFIERQEDGKGFIWRLYDTLQASMLEGKRIVKRGSDARLWAHELCDMLWPVLTGQAGFFSTKIAYCKEVRRGKKRPYKYLCVADYDGGNEQVIVPTMVVAPRWGKNGLLFYSECTNANIRLMYLDEFHKRHVIANFDGLNMQPSFSQDGTISVFCASKGRGSCQLYYCAPGIFKQLTHNEGTNVSPTITADGKTVYFCSDYKTGKPAIYSLEIDSGAIKELIASGLAPSYSSKVHKLAYMKYINGCMQLLIYDMSTGKSEQLTFDAGDKDECSWSACGNYLIYSVTQGPMSRIAALNIASHDLHWITPANANCTYPAPSPAYGTVLSWQAAISV